MKKETKDLLLDTLKEIATFGHVKDPDGAEVMSVFEEQKIPSETIEKVKTVLNKVTSDLTDDEAMNLFAILIECMDEEEEGSDD